jgi:hypothetical protein
VPVLSISISDIYIDDTYGSQATAAQDAFGACCCCYRHETSPTISYIRTENDVQHTSVLDSCRKFNHGSMEATHWNTFSTQH